jgi:hypothetical protein
MEPHRDLARDFLNALGRPFLGEELFDRIADVVFFLKDREARYVAVNEALVRRCGLTRISHTTFPLVINGRKSCLQFFRV